MACKNVTRLDPKDADSFGVFVMKKWKIMLKPTSLVLPLLDTHFSFKFQQDLFGQTTGSKRVNIRVDGMLPKMTLEAPVDALWKVFSQHDYMSRMFNLNEFELLPVHQMPGSNTKVVRFRSVLAKGRLGEGEQDIVYVCNRREQEIAKSTLAPPGKRKLLSSESEFGSVKATIISVMSTSLHSPLNDAPLRSMKVVKGAICWQEDSGVRITVLYSVPEEFRLMKRLNFHELVTSNDSMSDHFATILQEVGGEFGSLVEESASTQDHNQDNT